MFCADTSVILLAAFALNVMGRWVTRDAPRIKVGNAKGVDTNNQPGTAILGRVTYDRSYRYHPHRWFH